MDNPRIPPPTVCEHPRERWIAEGSSSWGLKHSPNPGKVISTSSHETYGWRCGICSVWIPNEGHKPEDYEHEIDDPGITVHWLR